MRIWKIMSKCVTNREITPVLLTAVFVGAVVPGGATLIEDREETAKEVAAEPVLSEGEYFQETPFGLTKRGPAKPVDEATEIRNVEVEENEDHIVFRRATPFGKQVWHRRRSDLSTFEKRLLEIRRKDMSTVNTFSQVDKSSEKSFKNK